MNSTIKILHLEDFAPDAELVKRELRKANINHEILVVENRKDFEKALKEFAPGIILSDHSLPSFNSVEALKIVQHSGTKVPFILVTATVSEDFAVEMMKSGVSDYILKDRLQRLPVAVLNALEMHRLELEREQFLDNIIANEALMKEAEKLARLGSFQNDLISRTVNWSDELYYVLGLNPGEIQPSRENFFKYIHRDDLDHVKASIDYAAEHLNQISIEYRIEEKGGKVKYVISKLMIARDISQKAISITGFVQDITPVKMAEMEISSLNDSLEKKVTERTAQLAEANNELQAFNYTVSHDLRSPLKVISGYTSILNTKYAATLPADAQDLIKGIRAYTLQMGRIIDELLYFSKVGHTSLAMRVVDMKQLVNLIIEELKKTIPGFRAEVILSDLKPMNCDAELMRHVWGNLISNAVKYSAKKEGPVIEIGTKNINHKDTYYVKDNGAGFDMKYAGKLFKVFQRLHNSSEFEGTGVGLALVHRIIAKHGGTVWADGKVDEGATFYFTLE